MEVFKVPSKKKSVVMLVTGVALMMIMCYVGINKWLHMHHTISVVSPLSRPPFSHKSRKINSKDCLSKLKDVLLIVNFNHPFYSNIPMLSKFYKDVFYDIVYCGPQKSKTYDIIHVEVSKKGTGYFGYYCVTRAMELHTNVAGYLFTNDDMVVNWWNFVSFDINRIWIGNEAVLLPDADINGLDSNGGMWWVEEEDLKLCGKTLQSIVDLIKTEDILDWKPSKCRDTFMRNSGGKNKLFCLRSWSDFFYIPKRYSVPYVRLSKMFHKNGVFLEVATNVIIMMLEENKNKINVKGIYLPEQYGYMDFSNGTVFWKTYTTRLSFIHPLKLGINAMNRAMFTVLIDHADLRRRLCQIK